MGSSPEIYSFLLEYTGHYCLIFESDKHCDEKGGTSERTYTSDGNGVVEIKSFHSLIIKDDCASQCYTKSFSRVSRMMKKVAPASALLCLENSYVEIKSIKILFTLYMT